MAGPVPTYLSTQTAAQTAFTVPFGLLTLVNNAIAAATAAGEFNVTVDCSLFTAEDVSNLRIYLDSQGYLVEFAKGTGNKSLLIDWGRFLDVPGTEILADQGSPTTLANGWPVKITDGSNVLGTPSNPIVVTSEGTTGTIVNEFATAPVPFDIETTILSYTVPVGKTLSISAIEMWGNYFAEYFVRVNGAQRSGTNVSCAERSKSLLFPSPLVASAGDIITVSVQHQAMGTVDFFAALMGSLA